MYSLNPHNHHLRKVLLISIPQRHRQASDLPRVTQLSVHPGSLDPQPDHAVSLVGLPFQLKRRETSPQGVVRVKQRQSCSTGGKNKLALAKHTHAHTHFTPRAASHAANLSWKKKKKTASIERHLQYSPRVISYFKLQCHPRVTWRYHATEHTPKWASS